MVSPDYYPPYGNPYGFVYNPIKVAVIDHGLRFGEGELNEIIVEHVAPRPIDLGAQVIFSLEYFVEVSEMRQIRGIVSIFRINRKKQIIMHKFHSFYLLFLFSNFCLTFCLLVLPFSLGN